MQRNGLKGACPECLTSIDWDVLSHEGVIHGRTQADGGPFFTVSCPACQERLIAEGGIGRVYRFHRERELPKDSRFHRALRFFFGKPKDTGAADRYAREAQRQTRERTTQGAEEKARSEPRQEAEQGRPGYRFQTQLNELGLSVEATLEEVKSRFRSLAKKYHPDVMRGATETELRAAEKRFVRVALAYRHMIDHWPKT